MQSTASGGDAGSADVSEIRNLHRGALGAGRLLFRGQLFWQQLLPEHVATNQLEFKIGMGDDSRNYARIPNSVVQGPAQELDIDDPRLVEAAVCIPSGREEEDQVAKAMRDAASWGDASKVRRLLASCFVPARACAGALCEASNAGHENVVTELLRAKADASSVDGASKKSALHFACEKGHESLAKSLLEAKASLESTDASGRSPCELAREQDLGMMAKRLEKFVAGTAS
mmetsp:Transcript_5286/g.11763  ORF Transcript_5286/g.11763 Transcript_5286/m.11763 type:complete len:230 (-) Transcript_5286:93-782(-)